MDGLGAKLRARARTLGLPDAEVARRLGLGASRYANYVNGTREPDFGTFVRICEVLETTPNVLLGFGEKLPKQPSIKSLKSRLVMALEAMDSSAVLIATEVVEAIAARSPGGKGAKEK